MCRFDALAFAGLFLVATSIAEAAEPPIAKRVVRSEQAGASLLRGEGWRPYERGFQRQEQLFLCDNGADGQARRGAVQGVELNQTRAEPIVASAWSKAEDVTGSPDSNYSIYMDMSYADGTSLFGQAASFGIGTHGWQRREVTVLPEKPVKRLSFYLLFRGHGGKAWFRDPQLRTIRTPSGACLFDGVPVVNAGPAREGFQVRDVAAGSDFVRIDQTALGLKLDVRRQADSSGGSRLDVQLTDTTGKDRAVTLLYAIPVASTSLRWLDDPRRSTAVEPGREYVNATRFPAGSNGRLSRYPLAAVADADRGVALAVDPKLPAFHRIGYHAGTGELYLAYDIGLTPEKPSASLGLCHFRFDPKWGFRGALAAFYERFPDSFRCRTPQQGLWMPFAAISKVQGWEDFGFCFKEGDGETLWDDQHGIFTFRYTEPMTWWMAMPKQMPRTLEAALAEARRLAAKGDPGAKGLLTSGYHDTEGRFVARLLDTPWCNGAVWSINSMPDIAGDVTDFKNKWNPTLCDKLYGPNRKADLDGEYIDSSEGYVTDVLDFRRDHFKAAKRPLVFSPDDHRPAIFRGLIAMEYAARLAEGVHGRQKLMMANGAPGQLWWLTPWLDVMGTETDWHHAGKWQPASDVELIYRRAMCKGRPYCFLMNTRFEEFSYELVEKYMKRSLAYGMFPGFFSHNASEGHYFTRPELYNRDRPLFKRYVPLCQRVAQAGWEPVTRARSSEEHVYVERFGNRYLTVFNDSQQRRDVTIKLEGEAPKSSRELLSGRDITWRDGETALVLDAEDVAVLELQ